MTGRPDDLGEAGDRTTGSDDDLGEPSVGVHLHFGMTGTVPLRLAELFFTDAGLRIVEYGTFTPLFGLATGGPRRAAAAMARAAVDGGLAGARDHGDRTVELDYGAIERVVLHDGGRLARERVAVHVAAGPPYAYRIHAPVDVGELAQGLASFGPTADLPVVVRSGVGFAPLQSLRRFRAGR